MAAATDSELVASLQELVGEEVSTTLASTYIARAKHAILRRRRPYAEVTADTMAELWEERFDTLCLQIAEFMYLKRGAEGQTKHTENGIAREWQRGDLPWDYLADVKPIATVIEKVAATATDEDSEEDEG